MPHEAKPRNRGIPMQNPEAMVEPGAFLIAADLARLPEDGRKYQLVEGRLVSMPPTGTDHDTIGFRLIMALGSFVQAHQPGGSRLIWWLKSLRPASTNRSGLSGLCPGRSRSGGQAAISHSKRSTRAIRLMAWTCFQASRIPSRTSSANSSLNKSIGLFGICRYPLQS